MRCWFHRWSRWKDVAPLVRSANGLTAPMPGRVVRQQRRCAKCNRVEGRPL